MIDLSPFRLPAFRLLYASSLLTNLGDGVVAVAIPWLATRLTDDPFLIGLVAACRVLPWFVFALPAGVLTDRFEHRLILMASDTARIAALMAILALAVLAPAGTAAALGLGALSFLIGMAEVLRDNTAQSFLPAVVPTERLEAANGILWSTEQAAGQFIGPPLAGALIAASMAAPFGLHGAALALAVAMVSRIALPRRAVTTPPQRFGAAMAEGLVWLWQHPVLRPLALTLGAFNFTGAMFWGVIVIYAQRVLGLDALGYGMLLTVAACGGIAGGLVGPALVRRMGPRLGLLIPMTIFVATALVMALTSNAVVVGVALAIDGFGTMLANVTAVSYRQRTIPAPLLGRVNSGYRLCCTGFAAFGAVAGGAMVAAAQPMGEAAALHLAYAVTAGLAGAILLLASLRLRLA